MARMKARRITMIDDFILLLLVDIIIMLIYKIVNKINKINVEFNLKNTIIKKLSKLIPH